MNWATSSFGMEGSGTTACGLTGLVISQKAAMVEVGLRRPCLDRVDPRA